MQTRDDAVLGIAGFLLLSALGYFAWQSGPLESARPVGPAQSSSQSDAPRQHATARLWQDPFSVINDYTKDHGFEPGLAELAAATRERKNLTILGFMVNGGSYPSLEEQRRRWRYAVLSALGAAGFEPLDAQTLGIAKFKEFQRPTPYELLEKPDGKHVHRVVVLWLENSEFNDSPFNTLAGIADEMRECGLPECNGNNGSPEWVLLGPASSDTLKGFLEAKTDGLKNSLSDQWPCGLRILSPLATASKEELIGDADDEFARNTILENYFDGTGSNGFQFRRTLHTDRELLAELVVELGRRGIQPHEPIATISEWDTAYGRGLAESFKGVLAEQAEEEPQLLRYSYERGIDGVYAGGGIRRDWLSDSADQPRSLSRLKRGPDIRRPVGPAQYDYLRRLARELQAKDAELRADGGRGIRAVAVLGSDVYDKLLVLRAIRPVLPGAVRLTTDLDANIVHPSEYQWTRNLIVASSYDLIPPQLSDDDSVATPPFRDSYQTSVYLATRLALAPDRKAIREKIVGQSREKGFDPQLHEVGRYGFVDLKPGGETTKERTAMRAVGMGPLTLLTLLIVAGFSLLLLYRLALLRQAVCLRIGSGIALIGIFGYIISDGGWNLEPFSFTDGVSIWPTEIGRCIAFFLVLAWTKKLLNDLKENAAGIDDYFLRVTSGESRESIENESDEDHVFNKRLAGFGIVALVISLFGMLIVTARLEFAASTRLILMAFLWGAIILIWWAFTSGRLVKSVTVKSLSRLRSNWGMHSDGGDSKEQRSVGVWNSYVADTMGVPTIMRALTYTAIYFAIASVIFTALPSGQTPCRGSFACIADKIVLGGSVIGMLFFLFLIVEIVLTCIFWVRIFKKNTLFWPDQLLEQWSRKVGVTKEHVKDWLRVRVIGERTNVVGRLVYYPVIVILVMVLSRSTYFDDWGFPQPLALVIGLNLVIAFSCAYILNRYAREARDEILGRLELEWLALKSEVTEGEVKTSDKEVEKLINDLKGFHVGAYKQLWSQPLLRSALLLISGLGIAYTEYLVGF